MHRKLSESSYTGSDFIRFYMEPKPDHGHACPEDPSFVSMEEDHVTIVQMQLWADMDSSIECGKYNVMVGHVCVRGFESYCRAGNEQGWRFVGQSVRDSLRSCGMVLEVRDSGEWILSESGEIVTRSHREAILVVAECMWSYGAREIDSDESGNNLRALLPKVRSL